MLVFEPSGLGGRVAAISMQCGTMELPGSVGTPHAVGSQDDPEIYNRELLAPMLWILR